MSEDTIDKIKFALADPKAPWYGSDLVEWVAELVEQLESAKTLIEKCYQVGHRQGWEEGESNDEVMKQLLDWMENLR